MGTLPLDTPQDIVEFYTYWLSLPKTNLLPDLSDYFDHVPPHLQPFVGIVDVFSKTETRVRLYGTGLSARTGADPTGESVSVLYSDRLKALSASILWETVSRPVGYLCVRDTQSRSGLTLRSPSICLPMKNKNEPVRLLINYSHVPQVDLSATPPAQPRHVTGWQLTHWIDVGAGVPEQP